MAVAVVTAMATTSCDNKANEVHFPTDVSSYTGQYTVSLYADNRNIETIASFALPRAEGRTLKQEISDDQTMTVTTCSLEGCTFTFPFLNEKKQPRQGFEEGLLAQLYTILTDLEKDGRMDGDAYLAFQNAISSVTETLSLGPVITQKMHGTMVGAAITLYDSEQRSPYHRLKAHEIGYSRSSSMSQAVAAMDMSKIQATPQELEEIGMLRKALICNDNGTLTDASGWMTCTWTNYHTQANMHLRHATGLLDQMSIAYIGKNNADGTGGIWLNITFDGDHINGKDYTLMQTGE